jgi:hypothetical protein
MTAFRAFYDAIKIVMKKFSTDQLIFALLVGAVIIGIALYRYFFMF